MQITQFKRVVLWVLPWVRGQIQQDRDQSFVDFFSAQLICPSDVNFHTPLGTAFHLPGSKIST